MDSSPRPEKCRLHLTLRGVQILSILVPTAAQTTHTTGDALSRLQTHWEMLTMPGISMMEFRLVTGIVAIGEIIYSTNNFIYLLEFAVRIY